MNNKKRSSADGATAPALKRRKASTMSIASTGSAHPLRQTSFPPDEISTPFSARSPSIDVDSASIVSGSQMSGLAAPAKKKRGRKSKADKAREQTPSLVGGKAGSASGAPKSNVGAPGAEAAEDDDGPEDDPDTEMINTKRSEHDRLEEKRLRAALTTCMDMDQFDRISAHRAAKLPDQVIKRLVNATVSQSVPANVVTAVRSVTKYFLTDLLTKARVVQDEWVRANDEKQAHAPYPGMVLSRGDLAVRAQFEEQAKMSGTEIQNGYTNHILKDEPMGPLRPDHLREAWRRYKVTNASQGAGTLNLWHAQQVDGVERFPVRTGGRRIFK